MSKLMKQLKNYGADIDGIMNRFLEDEALYESCFKTFLKDDSFVKLGEAIEELNYEQAFEYAHTLKGVSGNMGLIPLYDYVCRIVEELRAKEYETLESDYHEMMKQYKRLEEL
ncbi:MAG: Hpt domain-containing protein [Erysipelotrichaceae bacterium]